MPLFSTNMCVNNKMQPKIIKIVFTLFSFTITVAAAQCKYLLIQGSDDLWGNICRSIIKKGHGPYFNNYFYTWVGFDKLLIKL